MIAGSSARPTIGCGLPFSGEWVIDQERSHLRFAARPYLGVKIGGCFRQFAGSLHIAERRQDSLAELTIQAGSVETEDAAHTANLCGAEFLDAARFPTIVLLSTALHRDVGRSWTVAADLILRDVGRPILLSLTPVLLLRPEGFRPRLRLRAAGEIDLRRWNIKLPALDRSGEVADATVRLRFQIEAVPSREAALRPWWVQPA